MSEEFADAVLKRPPLNVSLKRIGKREHDGVEKSLLPAADEESREGAQPAGMRAWMSPPPRKLPARTHTDGHLATSSRPPQMATNLRSSLRGSSGGSSQKQVKKLVIKSTLGAYHTAFSFTSVLCTALYPSTPINFLSSQYSAIAPQSHPNYPTIFRKRHGQSSKRPLSQFTTKNPWNTL